MLCCIGDSIGSNLKQRELDNPALDLVNPPDFREVESSYMAPSPINASVQLGL
jgi:hypothetical protein